MKSRNKWWIWALPMYIFALVFVLCPLIYMVMISISTNNPDGYGFTLGFSIENYLEMMNPVYFDSFVQSLKLAISTTLITGIIGYPFGYFMARLDSRGKRIVMFLLMIPFWMSSLIRLYGWIVVLQANGPVNRLLLGLGFINEPIKLLYTYPAVLIGMVYVLAPFMILSVYSSVEKMDWKLVEAARDMGASRARAFFDITLKMTLPGLMTGIILTFVPSMGLFFIADILGGNKIVLVGSLIQDQMSRGSNWPFAAALSVVMAIMMVVMILLYRKITKVNDLEEIFR